MADAGDRGIERALRDQAAERPPLTPDAEKELLARLPDREASRDLVEHNLDLVIEQAETHADRGLSFADLYQEGTVGLLDAVGAYGGQGGFRQFASLHIGLQMDSLIEAESEARRQSEQQVADGRNLDMAQGMFKQRSGRDATDAELADLLGWDPGRVGTTLKMLELARQRNDALTLEFLDDAEEDVPEVEPDAEAYRKLPGHGPDE